MKNVTSNSTVIVTGGAGFIGSHLTEKLLVKGHKVICIDDFNDFYAPKIKWQNIRELKKSKNFQLVKADIRDQKKILSVFKKSSPSVVFHLAARAGVRPSLKEPLLYQDVNVRGTLNLLEASRLNEVKKFIFASSSSVYGNNKKVPFSETDNVDNPISPYAATKKAGELLCYTYHHLYGLPVACLRFFTVYGPRQRPEMAIHKFIREIDQGTPVTMYGKGNTYRDYTYIDDIISGVSACLHANFNYEIMNLGNSRTVPLRMLISTIEKELGKKAVIRTLPEQAGDVKRTFASITKARKLLSYAPVTDIAAGIKAMVQWYKQAQE
jgi:UDP-glucuronate 4-epimerase